MAIAWSSSPPGLFRRSMMKPRAGLPSDFFERVDLLYQIGVRLLVEGRDLDVNDIALEPRPDRIDADHVAHDAHVERIILAPAHDGEHDRGVDRPTHLLDRLLEREADDLLAVQMRDQVVGHQVRPWLPAYRRWATPP